MSVEEEIARELRKALEARRAGNHGKARTCARRAIGIAATELQRMDPGTDLGSDFMSQVRGIAVHQSFSEEARTAADRLQAKIGGNFTSLSGDPVSDAEIVISEITARLRRLQTRSSDR